MKLSKKEFEILRLLAVNAGRVLTHQYLLREVWGPAQVEENHYLRVYVGHLRQKRGDSPDNPAYIVTEPGVGYRFSWPLERFPLRRVNLHRHRASCATIRKAGRRGSRGEWRSGCPDTRFRGMTNTK